MRLVGIRHIDETKIKDTQILEYHESRLNVKDSVDLIQDNQYLELLGLIHQNRLNQVDSANRENNYHSFKISGC